MIVTCHAARKHCVDVLLYGLRLDLHDEWRPKQPLSLWADRDYACFAVGRLQLRSPDLRCAPLRQDVTPPGLAVRYGAHDDSGQTVAQEVALEAAVAPLAGPGCAYCCYCGCPDRCLY